MQYVNAPDNKITGHVKTLDNLRLFLTLFLFSFSEAMILKMIKKVSRYKIMMMIWI